ncbi:hypothetical protein F6P95_00420 [Escherichia coli]|nr:hypothetical protein F6P95_00420 [Escherichia coli]
MTAGFNFNNYAAGFCSATPALRGNEVSMDTIDLGNSESPVSLMFTSESMAEQKNINAPLFFNLKCQRE